MSHTELDDAVDERIEAESRAEAAEARAANAERQTAVYLEANRNQAEKMIAILAKRDELKRRVDSLQIALNTIDADRDEARVKLKQAQRESKSIYDDIMDSLPALWGDHVHNGKISVTLDADLIDRIARMP